MFRSHWRQKVSTWFSKYEARTASTQYAAEGMTPQLLSPLLDVIESSFRISGGHALPRWRRVSAKWKMPQKGDIPSPMTECIHPIDTETSTDYSLKPYTCTKTSQMKLYMKIYPTRHEAFSWAGAWKARNVQRSPCSFLHSLRKLCMAISRYGSAQLIPTKSASAWVQLVFNQRGWESTRIMAVSSRVEATNDEGNFHDQCAGPVYSESSSIIFVPR